MPGTIQIHNSGGKVLAPVGSGGVLVQGRHRSVLIVRPPDDPDLPQITREELVDLEIPIIFTQEEWVAQGINIPGLTAGSVIAYAATVVDVLETNDRTAGAVALRGMARSDYDMCTFAPDDFIYVNE